MEAGVLGSGNVGVFLVVGEGAALLRHPVPLFYGPAVRAREKIAAARAVSGGHGARPAAPNAPGAAAVVLAGVAAYVGQTHAVLVVVAALLGLSTDVAVSALFSAAGEVAVSVVGAFGNAAVVRAVAV